MGEKRGGHGSNTAVTDIAAGQSTTGVLVNRMRDTTFERQTTGCVVLQGRGASATTLQRGPDANRFTRGAKRSLCLSSRGVTALHAVVRGQSPAAGRPLMGQSAHYFRITDRKRRGSVHRKMTTAQRETADSEVACGAAQPRARSPASARVVTISAIMRATNVWECRSP